MSHDRHDTSKLDALGTLDEAREAHPELLVRADEPCLCDTEFTCLARHTTDPQTQEG